MSSETDSGAPSPAGFSAVMRAAYSQGPTALLQDTLRQSAEESLSSLELSRFPNTVCQLLLYIRSTVESLSSVGPC